MCGECLNNGRQALPLLVRPLFRRRNQTGPGLRAIRQWSAPYFFIRFNLIWGRDFKSRPSGSFGTRDFKSRSSVQWPGNAGDLVAGALFSEQRENRRRKVSSHIGRHNYVTLPDPIFRKAKPRAAGTQADYEAIRLDLKRAGLLSSQHSMPVLSRGVVHSIAILTFWSKIHFESHRIGFPRILRPSVRG